MCLNLLWEVVITNHICRAEQEELEELAEEAKMRRMLQESTGDVTSK